VTTFNQDLTEGRKVRRWEDKKIIQKPRTKNQELGNQGLAARGQGQEIEDRNQKIGTKNYELRTRNQRTGPGTTN